MDKEIEMIVYEVETKNFNNEDLKSFAEYNMSKKKFEQVFYIECLSSN